MPEDPNPKLRQPLPPPTSVTPALLPYAELNVTTNFSFLRGASHPDELVYRAAELGYRAIAITDHNTMAGVVRAHSAAKLCGLKLLIGTRLTLTDCPDLLVWTPDRASYGQLCRLLTLGKRRVEKDEFEINLEDFFQYSESFFVGVDLPPRLAGLGRAQSSHEPAHRSPPEETLHHLHDVLGDRVSLLASCTYDGDDTSHLHRMAELSRRTRIPLLASNAVHYHDTGRRALQDILTCVRHGCTIHDAGYRLFANRERHLKTPEQMHRLFADYPEAIHRGLEIAERCQFVLSELCYEYPEEIVPPGKTPAEHLRQLTYEGAAAQYPSGISEKVRGLLEKELAFITERHLEAYFLTVHDLVRYARSRDILCQGRGSAANSAVCFCLGVTNVDPSTFDLLFERFLSTARGEPPDIDIDFEHERREEVIQYVYQKYGRDRAGMTATLITYRGRSAVRDVGKALGLSLDVIDSLAKRLDWWHRGTLIESQVREAGADLDNGTVRLLIALSAELLGFPRHLSQHVGGMIISRGPLCEMVPIGNVAMDDRTVVEWDKDDVEELGLLKVDVLALGMLTAISKAFKLLNERHEGTEQRQKAEGRRQNGEEREGASSSSIQNPKSKIQNLPPSIRNHLLSLSNIPRDDPAVYEMISNADTIGVFQVESRAQMSMLPRLRPKRFYDLVIEVAIVRPGPIQGDMVHPYLRRRDGLEPVTYIKPELEAVLKNTLGVPLFQEQAMRVVMTAANFTAAEADEFRRAMASWKRGACIDRFRKKIIDGMLANDYSEEFAEQTYHQLEGFSGYGFPESHAASFAHLVYVSAWIKCHHPAVFCCALLNSQPMGFYAPAQLVRDAKDHGVTVLPPDVNCSQWDCTLEDCGGDQPAVRLGFRQIKGLNAAAMDRLIRTRAARGSFQSVAQLHRTTGVSCAALRRLAEADAFNSMHLSRRQASWEVMGLSDEQLPLFDDDAMLDAPPPSLPVMPLGQEVMTDYATAGLSLKAHPVSLVRPILAGQKIRTAREIHGSPAGRWVKCAGLVLVRQRPGTASGIVFVTVEDETGTVNLIVRPDIYERYRPAARHAMLLQCEGYVERQGQVVHVMAKRLFDRSTLVPGCSVNSRDFH